MICSCWRCYDDHWVKCASSWTVHEDEERFESMQLQSHQHVFAYKNYQINLKTNIRKCSAYIVSLWFEVYKTKVTQQTPEDEYVIKILKTSDLASQNCSSQINVWEALQILYVMKDLLKLCHLECTMLNFDWQQHDSQIYAW